MLRLYVLTPYHQNMYETIVASYKYNLAIFSGRSDLEAFFDSVYRVPINMVTQLKANYSCGSLNMASFGRNDGLLGWDTMVARKIACVVSSNAFSVPLKRTEFHRKC